MFQTGSQFKPGKTISHINVQNFRNCASEVNLIAKTLIPQILIQPIFPFSSVF